MSRIASGPLIRDGDWPGIRTADAIPDVLEREDDRLAGVLSDPVPGVLGVALLIRDREPDDLVAPEAVLLGALVGQGGDLARLRRITPLDSSGPIVVANQDLGFGRVGAEANVAAVCGGTARGDLHGERRRRGEERREHNGSPQRPGAAGEEEVNRAEAEQGGERDRAQRHREREEETAQRGEAQEGSSSRRGRLFGDELHRLQVRRDRQRPDEREVDIGCEIRAAIDEPEVDAGDHE